MFPAGFEPATLCVWSTRDNRYTIWKYMLENIQRSYQQKCALTSIWPKKELICFQPGSNRRPCACEAHVITTTLWKLGWNWHLISLDIALKFIGHPKFYETSWEFTRDDFKHYVCILRLPNQQRGWKNIGIKMQIPFDFHSCRLQIYAAKGNAQWDESKVGICLSQFKNASCILIQSIWWGGGSTW